MDFDFDLELDFDHKLNLNQIKKIDENPKLDELDLFGDYAAPVQPKYETLEKVKKFCAAFEKNKKNFTKTAEQLETTEGTLKKYLILGKLADDIIIAIDKRIINQEFATKLLQTKFAAADYMKVIDATNNCNSDMRKEILRECIEKKISTIAGLQLLVAEISSKFVQSKIIKKEKQKKLSDSHPFIYNFEGYKLEIPESCEKEIIEIVEKFYAKKYGAVDSAGAGNGNKNFINRKNIISAEMLKKFLE